MYTLISLHDRATIAAALRCHVERHLYELGDLDDAFWPYTTWYGLVENGHLGQIALLYLPPGGQPVLLLNADPPGTQAHALIALLLPILPRTLYSHLPPDASSLFAAAYHITPHGLHFKMLLANPVALQDVDTSTCRALTPHDLPIITELYASSYPGTWFDPRMLATDSYSGIFDSDRLVAIAGVHTLSANYGVAALGNVVTAHDRRGQGLAQRVCTHVCQRLLARNITTIGLNVASDNYAAIRAYQRLGFIAVAEYGEYALTAR